MRALKTVVAAFLLTLWIPATSYCLMERAGIIQCADCCNDSSGDCAAQSCAIGCGAVESTAVKVSTQTQNVSLPALSFVQLQVSEANEPLDLYHANFSCWPPDNLNLAEFRGRRTLPVRAPSSVA
jgi:hypothetical protein